MAEEVKATAEQTTRRPKKANLASTDFPELTVTLLDMAHANIEAAFEFARQAANARTSADVVALWTEHVPKQLELLSVQTKQLSELGQRLASRAASSIPHQR